MALTKVIGAGAEGLTLSSTSLTVANGLTLTDGNLTFANGHGVDFSATSNSSGSMSTELLDNYEEGTFTPIMRTASSANEPTYATDGQAGAYTRIGRKVTVNGYVNISSATNLGSSTVAIGGFPYTIGDTVAHTGVEASGGYTIIQGIGASTFVALGAVANTNYAYMYRASGTSFTDTTGFTKSNIDNDFNCRFSLTYFTA